MGWVKLHRKFSEWEWYQDSKMVHLFIHLLINANHEDNNWKGIKIIRGQLITGRKSLSENTGISERSIRTCLNKLKSTNEVSVKTTNKYSIITICNYDKYQNIIINNDQHIDQQPDQQTTSKRPTTDHKQEEKNIRIKETKNNVFGENWRKIEETYSEFKKMRNKIRKPMTELAEIRIIEKLGKLSNKDPAMVIKILENSIIKSWQDIYELPKEKKESSYD